MRRSLVSLLPTAAALTLPPFQQSVVGEEGTKDWRLFLRHCAESSSAPVSAWHDLPLRPAAPIGAAEDPLLFTYVNEIPRGTRAKMELLKEEAHNPIAQDVFKKKEGRPLRFFTYGDMPFNYGFIPRTWENPDAIDAATKCRGDGDPIDAVQLGPTATATGAFLPVRVLGVLALIDEGETDWKVVTEAVLPGKERDGYGSLERVPQELKAAITHWFRYYKTTDGKPENQFAFNGEIRGAEEALAAIHECSHHYADLMKTDGSRYGYWLR